MTADEARWAWTPGSFLSRISVEERADLLALGVTRTLWPGAHLLVEGKRDTHVEVLHQGYVKISGSVKISAGAAGVPRLLAVRLPGDIVGEFAAVTGSGRSATLTACGRVVSTIIRQADFLHFISTHPRVANQVTATVGERLRWAGARSNEFAVFPAHVRLARVLGDIAAGCGAADGEGVVIGVELNQSELATLVGAAVDTVQKALRLLRRQGLIRTGYRRITVLDPGALRGLVEQSELS